MAVTAASLILHCTHPVSGADPSGLPPASGSAEAMKLQMVNEAGRMLYNAWPWKFRERPPAYLNFTAPISITDATWTESTKTLTKVGGFASYTFAANDLIEITGGTGATTGEYTIASRTSDDAIVLADSIGSDADAETDIAGTISFPYVSLPTDFGQELEIRADGLTVDFELTTFGALALMRDAAVMPTGFIYFGAIVQPSQTAQTVALGNPRLEVFPTPNAILVKALTIWYRAKWRELTATTHYAAIPEYCESLLFAYIRAVSEGYQNAHAERGGGFYVSLTARVEEIEDGPLFKRATEADMLTQSNYGVVTGGLIGSYGSGSFSVVRAEGHDPWTVPDPWIT